MHGVSVDDEVQPNGNVVPSLLTSRSPCSPCRLRQCKSLGELTTLDDVEELRSNFQELRIAAKAERFALEEAESWHKLAEEEQRSNRADVARVELAAQEEFRAREAAKQRRAAVEVAKAKLRLDQSVPGMKLFKARKLQDSEAKHRPRLRSRGAGDEEKEQLRVELARLKEENRSLKHRCSPREARGILKLKGPGMGGSPQKGRGGITENGLGEVRFAEAENPLLSHKCGRGPLPLRDMSIMGYEGSPSHLYVTALSPSASTSPGDFHLELTSPTASISSLRDRATRMLDRPRRNRFSMAIDTSHEVCGLDGLSRTTPSPSCSPGHFVEDLMEQLRVAKSERDELQSSLNAERSSSKLLRQELGAVTKERAEAVVGHRLHLQTEERLQELQQQVALSEVEIRELRLKLKQVSLERDGALAEGAARFDASKRLSTAEAMQHRLQAAVDAEKSVSRRLQLQLETALRERDEAMTRDRLRVEADKRIAELQVRLAASTSDRAALLQSLEHEQRTMRLKLDEVVSERDRLLGQLQQSQGADGQRKRLQEQLSKVHEERAELLQRLETAEAENRSLQEKLDSTARQLAEVQQSTQKELQQQCFEVQERLMATIADSGKLSLQLEEEQDRTRCLEQQLEALKQTKQSAEDEVQVWAECSRKLEESQGQLLHKLAEKEEELHLAHAEAAELRSDLEKERLTSQRHLAELALRSHEHDEAELQRQEIQAKLSGSNSELSRLAERLGEVQRWAAERLEADERRTTLKRSARSQLANHLPAACSKRGEENASLAHLQLRHVLKQEHRRFKTMLRDLSAATAEHAEAVAHSRAQWDRSESLDQHDFSSVDSTGSRNSTSSVDSRPSFSDSEFSGALHTSGSHASPNTRPGDLGAVHEACALTCVP